MSLKKEGIVKLLNNRYIQNVDVQNIPTKKAAKSDSLSSFNSEYPIFPEALFSSSEF